MHSKKIKQSRKIEVEGVVVTFDVIMKLATVVSRVAEQVRKSGDTFVREKYTATSEKNTSYTSESKDLYKNDTIYPILGIEMNLYSSTDLADIDIDIESGNSFLSRRAITIKGEDWTVVNSLFTEFNDIISSCERQPRWPKLLYIPIIIFLLLLLTASASIVIGAIMLIFAKAPIETDKPALIGLWQENESFRQLVAITSLISIAVSIWLADKIKDLWPIIEFRVGPSHKHLSNNRRSKMMLFLSLFVLPIIIAFLVEAIKALF